MATIRDVANMAGVSIATVSRVINQVNTVAPDIRLKVEQAIESLGYRPNAIARSLKRDETHVIGVLLPHIGNSFFMDVAKGIEDGVRQTGYSLLIASSDWTIERERHHLQVFFQHQVDGIVLCSIGDKETSRDAILQSAHVPLVLVDRQIPGISADAVLPDNIGGMGLLVDHLVKLGHRRIGLLSGPAVVETGWQRREGYRAALEKAGLIYDPALVREAPDFNQETGEDLAHELLLEHPTAIIGGNNTLAIGSLIACRKLGIRIPRDLSVAAFGDLEFSTLLATPLTVCTNSGYLQGQAAAQLLLRRMERPDVRRRRVSIPSTLIERASTASRPLVEESTTRREVF